MATTNYRISTQNTDLNAVFDPYVSGSRAYPTGYQDVSGNDLSTNFEPYVTGRKAVATGYQIDTDQDLNEVFAPFTPNFPTAQSTVPNIAHNNCISMDGDICVFSTQGWSATGDPYAYLYWSDDFCGSLNQASISTSTNINDQPTIQKFFGSVAISGQNAIAVGGSWYNECNR